MLQRLIEGWLDKINERGYQPAFCTALSADGFVIEHNTRHSPIEFGKDIIARGPDGRTYMYQLKGDPGGRLTANQFRALIPQLDALVALRWSGAADSSPQIPVFVTNGYIDEEARQAVDQYNLGHVALGRQPLQLMDRGELLALFGRHAQAFFPTDPDVLRRLLQIIALPGDETLDAKEIQTLLLDIHRPSATDGAEVLTRASYAIAIMSEIATGRFCLAGNEYEAMKCRVCCLAAILAWHHQAARPVSAETLRMMGLLRIQAFDSIDRLQQDLLENHETLARNVLSEGILIDWRREVMSTVFAASLVEDALRRRAGWSPLLSDDHREYRSAFCRTLLEEGMFWGERSHLAHLFAYLGLSAGVGNGNSDKLLARILMSFIQLRQAEVGDGFANVYYDYEWVMRQLRVPELRTPENAGIMESFKKRSRFFEGVFFLICRKNWKQHAKAIWETFVSFTHVRATRTALFRVAMPEDDDLSSNSKLYEESIDWFECLTLAEEHGWSDETAFFAFDVPIAILWLSLFPYRASSNFLLDADRLIQPSINLERTNRGHTEVQERLSAYGLS